MNHAWNPDPLETETVPPEVRAEAMASKGRVRARLQEVMARIKDRDSQPSSLEATDSTDEPSDTNELNERIDPISAVDWPWLPPIERSSRCSAERTEDPPHGDHRDRSHQVTALEVWISKRHADPPSVPSRRDRGAIVDCGHEDDRS